MTVNSQLDVLRLTGTVIRLHRYLDRRMTEAIEDTVGLTELTIMGSIDRGIDLSANIARSLQLDPPRVTRLVDRLCAHGFLVRGIDARDRRRSPLRLTSKGEQLLTTGRRALTDAMTDVLEVLSEPGRSNLVTALEAIRAVVSEEALETTSA